MNTKRLFVYFLVVVLIDVLNKHLYLAFSDAHTLEKVYWTGQSVSFLAYIVFIWIVAKHIYSIQKDKWTLLLKLSALNWIAFGVNVLTDELMGEASQISILEYAAFIITIGLTIREWQKHIRKAET